MHDGFCKGQLCQKRNIKRAYNSWCVRWRRELCPLSNYVLPAEIQGSKWISSYYPPMVPLMSSDFNTIWHKPLKIRDLRCTPRDLSFDIRHTNVIITLDFFTQWARSTPSDESESTRSETYSSTPFILYTFTLLKLRIFALDEPFPPSRMDPKRPLHFLENSLIRNRKRTRRDLSLDLCRHVSTLSGLLLFLSILIFFIKYFECWQYNLESCSIQNPLLEF